MAKVGRPKNIKSPDHLWELFEKNGYLICDGFILSKSGKKLIGGKDKKGYVRLCLSVNGNQITVKEHRVIAQKYIQNPNNKPQVNHINGVKHDNRICNLEWVTNSENCKHAIASNLRSYDNFLKAAHEATSKIILNKETGIFYLGTLEASYYHCLNRNTLRGKLNSTKFNNTNLIYV